MKSVCKLIRLINIGGNKSMSSIKQETLSGIKWTSIERFSVQGVQFLLGLVMARLLSPSDYGMVGMLAVFMAISQTFIDSGFSNALIRKKGRTETDFVTVFYFNFAISCICYIILFIAAPVISSFFKLSILCPILRVLSLNLILNSMVGVHIAKLTIDLNFKVLAKANLGTAVISGLVGIILAYYGFGVWALVIQSISGTIVSMLFIWFFCKWIPRGRFSKESFHDLFAYGSKILLSGLLNTLYGNLNPLVIGKYFSAQDLGFYSRGTQLARYPINTINGVFSKVTFPILARIQDDDVRLVNVYRKYICVTSMCIFLGCLLLAALSKPLILLVLTDKWQESIVYLQIYSFAIMFDHINSINLNLLQVKGRSDLFLRLEILKKIISTLILFASIPFGVIGICISKIVYSQIAVLINTYYTGKLFGLGYLAQVKDFCKYFILAILAVLPAYLLCLGKLHPALILILGGIVAIGVYTTMLKLSHDVYFNELYVLAKKMVTTYGCKTKNR